MKDDLQQNKTLGQIDCGIVVGSSQEGFAQVMLPRREGCRYDAWSKSICHQLDQDNMVLKAHNPLKAKEGNMVELKFETPGMGRSMFIVYILPILALIIGAGLGNGLDPFGNQNVSAAIGALVFLVLGLWLVFSITRRQKGAGFPTITNILQRSDTSPESRASYPRDAEKT
ncbi:MAG: SoxR reducing system RseC family protein [Desulfohalobiaceae bacterium]|nr:SoxR reducing system RseC family protein [Desulfohalobiaceae bacterium]